MKACPGLEQLQQLLAEELSTSERAPIESHIESCAACQEMLAKLTGSLALVEPQTRGGGQSWSRHEPDSRFLRGLQQAAMDTTTGGEWENADQTAPSRNDSAAAASAADWPPVPSRLGRFEIRRMLGRGGFGEVYLAHDTQLHRDVALKVPRLRISSRQSGDEFLREASRLAQLQHPGIVTVHDVGVQDGVC